MRQLQQVEVYQAENVVVKWKVLLENGATAEGEADTGRVKIAAQAEKLQVYLTARDNQPTCPPLELHEEISNFCGLTDSGYIAILQHVLMSQDEDDIKDLLQRRGVPNKIPEFELAENGASRPLSRLLLTFLRATRET
jgi:hypothetical protein